LTKNDMGDDINVFRQMSSACQLADKLASKNH